MSKRLLGLYVTLKELERERQYRGLKRYVRILKRKGYLNGKEQFILRGATAHLNRMQADRRARSLGLVDFLPYDEQENRFRDRISEGDFRSWIRTMEINLICR